VSKWYALPLNLIGSGRIGFSREVHAIVYRASTCAWRFATYSCKVASYYIRVGIAIAW
jgi:hypothetical protein